MSVIVKGMEMPNACCHCPCSDSAGCAVTGRAMTTEEMAGQLGDIDDCPLRPLPERHGRLIEAERLRAEFPYPSEGMGGWRDPDEALVHKTGVWAAIDCAETIVEAEGE